MPVSPDQQPVVGQSAPNQSAPASTPVKMAQAKKYFLFGFGGFLIVVLALTLGIGIYRVYAKASTDKFSLAMASTFHLSAMKVNGVSVPFKDYADDLRAITTMRDYDKAKSGPAASLTNEQLTDQVLFRQVNNILVNQLATKYGVTVDPKDLEDVKTNVLQKEFKSMTEAEQAIKDRYGWSLAIFTDKVIKPYVLQNKLNDKIKSDATSKDQIKTQAQTVLDQLKGGADFAALAKQYGQDGTAPKGGELGWFGHGEMVQAFEAAAFSLKKGEISPTLVESQYGYHIIQVEDKRTDKVKDAKGKSTSKDMVEARHILFMFPTLEKLLNDEVKNANIKILIKVHNPFDAIQHPTTTPSNSQPSAN